MGLTTGILVFDDVEELDFVGPLSVFGCASRLSADDRVVLIGKTKDAVRGTNGAIFLPAFDFADAPPLDVVLVPGGRGTDTVKDDETVQGWLQGVAKDARWIASVCSGSFVLHSAGLAAGRSITTHHGMKERLRSLGANVTEAQERYVVDDPLVTSAGVSAGIDMALWLLGALKGVEFARKVQAIAEYYPRPPYSSENRVSVDRR